MAVVDVSEKHQDLVDELLAAVSDYNPDADRELLSSGLLVRSDSP